MPVITLPDGSQKQFGYSVSVGDVAAAIGPGLAKAALAGKVNGALVDLSTLIESDSTLSIITDRDPEGLDVIRHSTAHLLANAVQELFPDAQVTIGPVIEDGFFYDFAYKRPFSTDDLAAIEKRMGEIVAKDLTVHRRLMERDAAVKHFNEIGEHYKAEIIAAIPSAEPISLYGQGDWEDLCRGPHVPSTGKLKAFKLMKVAGAYWRGDSRNEMLQRIYGTAWANEKQLKEYLTRLDEAEKRDHRRIGKELDLFHLQEEAPGAVFWHPKGWALFQQLIGFMRERQTAAGYHEVNTPEIMDRELWIKSGHMETFGENMFMTQTPDERVFAIKPMNCPGHIQVFRQGLRSYRELPLRLAEFGKVHRYEPSGALHGLMRVRAFTQDDAHVFCTPDQLTDEAVKITELILSIYRDFGFADVRIKFSDRPAKRVGSDEVWDKAEAALRQASAAAGIETALNPGEGAFYGPKLEFVLRDAIGRDWQCGTLQVDFNLPARLGASFVGEDGQKHTPVMLHRAIFGSLERFTGILLEHHAGKLPTWLAPVQAVVMGITNRQDDYCLQVAENLRNQGLRVETDLRYEKVAFKIREHTIKRVPYLLVAGDREVEARTLAVRTRSGKDLGGLELNQLTTGLCDEVASRGRFVFGGSLIATSKRVRRNEEISAPSVRVIAADGSQAGVMTRAEALQLASSQTLDLVEVSPMAEPPVVRVMDFGKFLFEQNKKAHAAKRKQKQIQVKEVKFRPGTEEADYQVKLRNIVRFLTEGDKAKVTLRYRGRELVHQDIGRRLLTRISEDLAPYSVVEQNPLMEGKQMIMVFGPKKK